MGPLGLIVGIILVLVALGTNTAPGGTHNLGLLQQQMMTLHCGLALLIVSAIRWEKAPARGSTTVELDELDEATILERRARANKIT